MNSSIGVTLAKLRRSKGLIQKEVASKLSGYGISVSSKTIYNWEKGLAMPGAHQFLALCDILEVDDILWQFSGIHKGLYAGLNSAGRQKAKEFIDVLFHADIFRDDSGEVREMPRHYRLYDTPVSAGTGNFLDVSSYEMIEAPGFVPVNAEFALRITGNSMEPLLQDGRIVWIKTQDVLDSGDIGIFVYYDEVFWVRNYRQSHRIEKLMGEIIVSQLNARVQTI